MLPVSIALCLAPEDATLAFLLSKCGASKSLGMIYNNRTTLRPAFHFYMDNPMESAIYLQDLHGQSKQESLQYLNICFQVIS